MSKAGNEMLVCDYSTPTTQFRAYYIADSDSKLIQRKWTKLCHSIFGGDVRNVDDFVHLANDFCFDRPDTVTYQKNKTTGYFDVIGHNYPINEAT